MSIFNSFGKYANHFHISIPTYRFSSENLNRELKLSPRKQAATKCSTNTMTKSSHIRKTASPSAKKLSIVLCKSPNSKKTISPTLIKVETECPSQTIHDSNAIQTAKRLKRTILETNEHAAPCSESNQMDDTAKCTNNTIIKSHMFSKPIKKQKRAHEFCDSGDEEQTVEEIGKKGESKSEIQKNIQNTNAQLTEIQWTREEDRLLLEQIKAGIDSNIKTLAGFEDRFPNKSMDQIRDRIDFLIDFLTKLRNKT